MKDDFTKYVSAVALTGNDPVAVTSGSLPKTISLFCWGENPSTRGSFFVNETSLAAVQQQIDSGAFRRVVVDFEHQSSKQSPNYKPAPRHHVAYGDVAITSDNSIVLQNVTYTPTGEKFAHDFYDVSPVPIHTKDGVILGIQSVGLVTQGALLESTLFSAEFSGGNPQEKTMDEETKALLEQLKTDLAAAIARIAALEEGAATPLTAEALAPVQTQAAAAETALAEHKTLLDSQGLTISDQAMQITALDAALMAQRKETMIQMATLQGKAVTLTDQAVTDLTVEDLAQHLSTLGATVPLVRQTRVRDADIQESTLSVQQNELVDKLRKETGVKNFGKLWAMARERQPALFA